MSGLYVKKRRRPELNLVPLIDVLVMLVFFAFVTMQFRSMTTMNLTLPKGRVSHLPVTVSQTVALAERDEREKRLVGDALEELQGARHILGVTRCFAREMIGALADEARVIGAGIRLGHILSVEQALHPVKERFGFGPASLVGQ